METLLKEVKGLSERKVRDLIEKRIREFKDLGKKSNNELFKELCFCILTANFNAERSIRIQKKIGDGFLTLPEDQLSEKLAELGHRYPRTRAKYIVMARKHKDWLKRIIQSYKNEKEAREWLVKNIKGLGYKEASHFLRNIGFTDLAILDIHILNVLSKHGIIEKPRTLTKKRYLQIEEKMRRVAEKLGLNLSELDLYLWYMETGRVLK